MDCLQNLVISCFFQSILVGNFFYLSPFLVIMVSVFGSLRMRPDKNFLKDLALRLCLLFLC